MEALTRTVLVAAVLALVCGHLVAAQAPDAAGTSEQSDEQSWMKQAESAGALAGETAGSKAGREAGGNAGREVAAQILANVTGTNGGLPKVGPTADPFTENDFQQLQEKDPGATQFFLEFDTDGDKHWNQAEWIKGIRAAIDRKFLTADFDLFATWGQMPKDDQGRVNLRDFLAFASKTKAAKASATGGGSLDGNVTGQFQNCRQMFDKFDADHSGGLSLVEFTQAVAGKVDANAVSDTYYTLPRNANGATLDQVAWTAVCINIFGIQAADPSQPQLSDDPCQPNPCTEPGKVCVPDPKKCIRDPCPQFKCVAIDTTIGKALAQGKNEYGRCVFVFRNFDKNGDRALSYREFYDGVKAAQASGKIGRGFRIMEGWRKLEKTPRGQVDIYEFIHLCVAITAGEDDALASAKEECWDVFTHFDEDQSQDLSAREFFKGMRRARRQGHLPADMNIDSVWRALPRSATGNLDVGPFVDFCLSMSKGDDPQVAAADAASGAPAGTYMGDYQADYGGNVVYGGSEGVSTVGLNNANMQYCVRAFKRADTNNDGSVSLDEFRVACPLIGNDTECGNYTAVFQAYKLTPGDTSPMTSQEFVNACKGSSISQAGDAERARRMALGGVAGAKAGREAGADAGEKAGRRAGAFVAANAVPTQSTSFVESETVVVPELGAQPRELHRAVVDGYLQ